MYFLDTNIVCERRKPRPHGGVVAWLRSAADADLHLSAVTLGAIQAGVELARDQDASKAAEIQAWLDLVAQSYNVLPMDGAAFRTRARLMRRRSDTLDEDAMVAASATVHKLTVVGRSIRRSSRPVPTAAGGSAPTEQPAFEGADSTSRPLSDPGSAALAATKAAVQRALTSA